MALQPEWLTRLLAIAPNPYKPPSQRPIQLAALALIGLSACTARTESLTQPQPQSSTEIKTERPADATLDTPPAESAVTPNNPDNPDAASAPGIDIANCQAPSTQTAMNLCAQVAYTEADTNLNRVYQSVKAAQTDSGQRALGTAEVAWISFRDLDCAFERDQYEGGSIAPMVYSNCLAERTRARTAELQRPELPQISYQAADAQLNRDYQALMSPLTEERTEALIKAQMAWLEYRDRNCDFEVLYSPIVIEKTQCLARMSTVRIAQLQTALDQNSL